jgi:hypothetical protein
MWRAYLDDSGHRQHSPVLVLGGWIAPIAVWNAFVPDWDAMLAVKPAIEYFKMNESATLTGHCRGRGSTRAAKAWAYRERRRRNGRRGRLLRHKPRLDRRQSVSEHRGEDVDHLPIAVVGVDEFTPHALYRRRQHPVLKGRAVRREYNSWAVRPSSPHRP